MLSNGGVHSHISHLIALTEWAKKNTNDKIILHLFLDGRDMAPQSAQSILKELNPYLDDQCTIATACGRGIGMDRTENWDRTLSSLQNILETLFPPEEGGQKKISSWINEHYFQNITDEFMPPARFTHDVVKKNDAIIFLALQKILWVISGFLEGKKRYTDSIIHRYQWIYSQQSIRTTSNCSV